MTAIIRRAGDLAAKVVTRSVRVHHTEAVGGRFRSIELAGESLHGVSWTPGDKVQLRVGGLSFRTYTPISLQDGRMRLLAFAHGSGPGSTLVDGLAVGDEVQIFGPRSSVDLRTLDSAPVVVGDETSFALALALAGLPEPLASGVTHHLFEVDDPDESAAVLGLLGVDGALLTRSEVGGSTELVDRVVDAVRAAPDAPLVLTGRAQTIAAVRRRLKDEALRSRTLVKAYWDEHRSGLD